ncbi:AhpC/TSA family protein [Parabacteroides sp. OttesenSCG-928-K15]|nr:AhpC/TSA family protein [Parabacteroides sp. OttesenSCG-928-K15]
MKKLFIFPVVMLCLFACGERSNYDIKGTVDDLTLNGQYVYLYEYGNTGASPKDSALIEHGKFALKGEQPIPALYTLRFAESKGGITGTGEIAPFTALFVLQNAKYTVDISESSVVAGTPENQSFSQLQKAMKELRKDMGTIHTDMRSDDEAVSRAASERYDQIETEVKTLVRKYMDDNPDARTSAKLFYDYRYELGEEERREIAAKAGEAFLGTPGIDRIVEHLAILEKVAVGKKFTDFEMAGPTGAIYKLSDYAGKGKIVLVDFWASWCPPCRADMPHLVSLYQEYAGGKFEIVGVSLDRTEDAWKKGIAELNITWPQMSDLKFWHNEAAALYGVNSIPHTLLIDGEGTIIAKNLRGKALEDKLAEILK